MLKALLRVRMTALGKWFTGATAKKGKQTKGSMIGFAFLMVYAFGAAGFGIWHLFDVLAAPFHTVGLDWLVYALAEKFIPSAKIQQMKILFPFLVSPEQMEQEILRLIMTNMM